MLDGWMDRMIDDERINGLIDGWVDGVRHDMDRLIVDGRTYRQTDIDR